ncbi:hypothetical protein BDZ91DRAFT_846658 [Kalaharituber pfeilii]|nr:hypothetical protein BDZ91DRAFT_846658 [Kalaharituber pfeilii]
MAPSPAPTSSSSLLTEFLTTLSTARATKNAQFLSNILLLSPYDMIHNPLMLHLQSEIMPLSPAYVENKCYEVLGEDWTAFTDLVISYVATYLRALDIVGIVESVGMGEMPAMGGMSMGDGARKLEDWRDGLSALVGQISSAFSSPQGTLLIPLIKAASTILSSLAIRIDSLTRDPRQPAANDASRVVLRAFNIALGDRTTGNSLGKKEAAFHLANVLFKLYFKLDQIRLCPTIHTNLLQSALPPLLPTHFPKSQHCTYKYYLGRHHLFTALTTPAALLPAFSELQSAYTLCPLQCGSQRRKILTYLLPAAILIGKAPSKQLYSRPEAYGLEAIFSPLVTVLRRGDFAGFRHELRCNAPWLKKVGIYLLLWSCSPEILWQALARRTFMIVRELRPPGIVPPNGFGAGASAKTPPPQLSLVALMTVANFLHRPTTAAPLSFPHQPPPPTMAGATMFSEGDEFTLDDIEGVVLDLLDQGMLKGYIARQQKVVVLKREGWGFVGVEEARKWKANNFVAYGDGGGSGGGDDGAGVLLGWGGGKIKLPGMRAGGGGVVRLSGVKAIGS